MVRRKQRVDIREMFLGRQEQMRAQLNLNKKILTHPVAKGDSGEVEWKNLFGNLPARYSADKAFVIDCKGKVSDQIDIVIHDRHYSPFILHYNGNKYIPAESVYAVIEVKPTLNKGNVLYAADKAASVRRLKRTAAPIVHAGGKIKKPKKPFNILAGILTTDGQFTDSLASVLLALAKERTINFGCSLEHISFWMKTRNTKYANIKMSHPKECLIFFFLNLLAELQGLGTVPAIDLQEYVKALHVER